MRTTCSCSGPTEAHDHHHPRDIDLPTPLRFDMDRRLDCARRINPAIWMFPLLTLTGEGLNACYGWLEDETHRQRPIYTLQHP